MRILLLFNLLTILLRPTFNSCGVYGEGVQGADVKWREAGSAVWSEEKVFRGSILGLKEDTEYELLARRPGQDAEMAKFRTWKSDVPVARTIEIDPAHFKAPFKVDQKGSEDGWIRITVKGGKLHNPYPLPTFDVDGAEYVLLDDMVITGAADSPYSIHVQNSKAVRIRNCDISGWGSSNCTQNFTPLYGSKRYGAGNGHYVNSRGRKVDHEGAIYLAGNADMTVIERCYIHDPLSRSCSWFYSHPAGPVAVVAARTGHSTVIRWNDFIGSDAHRWNDAVEGPGNFEADGGLNRDADIFGNFMIYANDDCIELDGGQQNIRCFGNRFEGSMCGVSVQGCMVGPSFVYDNLFSGMCEEFGLAGQTIKTGKGEHGDNARSYMFGNLLWGHGTGITARTKLRASICGNRFCSGLKLSYEEGAEGVTEAHDNVFGLELNEDELPATYPERPVAFTLSRTHITVGKDRKPVRIDIIGNLPEKSKVCIPSAMDWLEAGIRGSQIIVKFNDRKMHDRREYRGAFIVRTPDGFSRPVSVYASSDFVPDFHPDAKGHVAIYAKDFQLMPKGSAEVVVNVPKDGVYFAFLHGPGMSVRGKVRMKLDGVQMDYSDIRTVDYPAWTMLCPNSECRQSMVRVYAFNLTAGRHTFILKSAEYNSPFDGFVLTDDPKTFEPR